MKILFVHNCLTRFVQLDLNLLRASYEVTELYLPSRSVNPLSVAQRVRKHDLVFGWFASWHTFLPMLFARLMQKPSLLIIGGYDLANLPEANYGSQRGGVRRWVSRQTMHMASALVTNAYFSRHEAEKNAGIPADQVRVIYHGVPDPYEELPAKADSLLAITVGNVWQENLWRKGLEPFVRAAAYLPEVEFALVGAWRDDSINHLQAIATPNVTFTGWVEDDTLLDYYRRAHVYVQASAHEGFGMSVAEAMLAGCVPVVTRQGALPEVVGSAGEYADSQEAKAIVAAMRRALQADEAIRVAARRRVLTKFTLERRAELLGHEIQKLLQ